MFIVSHNAITHHRWVLSCVRSGRTCVIAQIDPRALFLRSQRRFGERVAGCARLQALLQHMADNLLGAGKVHLSKQPGTMSTHRLIAHAEQSGNLAASLSLDDKMEHLGFPWG